MDGGGQVDKRGRLFLGACGVAYEAYGRSDPRATRAASSAEFGGIRTTRVVATVAFLSGGLAGLAGAGELAGIQFHLMEALSAGYGYSGIVVAMPCFERVQGIP